MSLLLFSSQNLKTSVEFSPNHPAFTLTPVCTLIKSIWERFADVPSILRAMWHWNVPKKAVGEASSTQIWEGETVMPGDWSGNVQMTDDAAKAVVADAQVGQVIRVAVKDVAAGAQGSFKNSGWSEIASGTDYFDISGDYTLVITEDVLKSLQEGGLIIGGHDYTAVAVYLENNGTALDPNKDYAL